jgi:threonine aldolase
MKSFASDNNAPVSAEVIEMLSKVNVDHAIGYGDDMYTKKAIGIFKDIFGKNTDIYFLFTGTAANVLGISSVIRPYHSVICAGTAHYSVDECGAPERFSGSKLTTVNPQNGKLTRELIQPHLTGFGFEHHAQPKIISIAQPTELGTLYSVEEIEDLSHLAHDNDMYLHMDGARLANAAVALNKSFRELTADAGVDILSFGGTKNGLMAAEAVVFFNTRLSKDFKYIRKQGMQLGSKMRYIAAQFIAYFENELWKKNAEHANNMAQLLVSGLNKVMKPNLVYPVETNAIFIKLSPEIIYTLQKEFFFYVWDEYKNIVRWMTSFDTTKKDIELFVTKTGEILKTKT